MVRLGTVAAALGIIAGVWTVVASLEGLTRYHSLWSPLTTALAAVLVIDSVVCLVGPKLVFYASVVLSILLGGSIFLGSGSDLNLYSLLAIGLAGATFVLSLIAARSESKVSEQSHPMNLPVFG